MWLWLTKGMGSGHRNQDTEAMRMAHRYSRTVHAMYGYVCSAHPDTDTQGCNVPGVRYSTPAAYLACGNEEKGIQTRSDWVAVSSCIQSRLSLCLIPVTVVTALTLDMG